MVISTSDASLDEVDRRIPILLIYQVVMKLLSSTADSGFDDVATCSLYNRILNVL